MPKNKKRNSIRFDPTSAGAPIETYSGKSISARGVNRLESPVRFSFRDVDIKNNNYGLGNCSADQLASLFKRLGHFEKMKWRQLKEIARGNGFSYEKKDSDNHKRLTQQNDGFTVFAHFRVNDGGVFRVFVGIDEDLAYLLLIDRDGKFNRGAH